MFAVKFDDLARKLINNQDKPIFLNKLITAQQGTPEFEAYLGAFLLPENETIEVSIEEDNKTYTFYTVITDPHMIELAKKRKAEKFDESERARLADTHL